MDRADHLMIICREMEEHGKRNRSKDLLSKVEKLTRNACPAVKVIRAQNGQTVTQTADILERWKEYCESLSENTANETYVHDGAGTK